MRIIAGKHRGRKLFAPQNRDIRPTSDRAKEALFNIIQWEIKDCVFVDCFSGSGAVGIEALSRGAGKVYFVDNDRNSVALIRKNLQGVEGNYEILEQDYLQALGNIAYKEKKGVDFIFADPPYKFDADEELFGAALKLGLLDGGGKLLFEHGIDKKIRTKTLYKYDSRVYGIAEIDFFRKPTVGAVTGTFDPFTKGHLYVLEEALDRFDFVHIVFLINPDKKPFFDLGTRMEMARIATDRYSERVIIASFDGMAADYLNNHGIKYAVRGMRNANDEKFEREMADYNRAHGGVETIIITAKDKFISSTEVKNRIARGEDCDDCIDGRLLSYFEVKND